MSLSSRKKFGFLDGTIPKPAATSSVLEDWTANNHLLVGWIKLTIEPHIRTTISTRENAKELWDVIKKLTGSIPGNLSSSTLKQVILNDNDFQGRLPDEIYLIQFQGGNLNVCGNKDLCGIGLRDLPQCSLLIMASDRKGVAFRVTIAIVTLVGYLMLQRGYDANSDDPNIGLVEYRGYFRIKIAVCILLFHFVRIIMLYKYVTEPEFDAEGRYNIWCWTILVQMLRFLVGCCVFTSTLMRICGHIKSSHTVAILGCFLYSTSLSAVALMKIQKTTWLSIIEWFWMILNVCIMFAFYVMTDTFDLKQYLIVKVWKPAGSSAFTDIGPIHLRYSRPLLYGYHTRYHCFLE